MPLPKDNGSHASGLAYYQNEPNVEESEEINEDEFNHPGNITIRPGQLSQVFNTDYSHLSYYHPTLTPPILTPTYTSPAAPALLPQSNPGESEVE